MMGYIIENTFIGVIIVNINKNIISFAETAEIAANSEKTVLLVRHSYRESVPRYGYCARRAPRRDASSLRRSYALPNALNLSGVG